MTNGGDLSHIQGGLRQVQGGRDYASALQGNFRTVLFRQPMSGTGGAGYTPSTVGVVTGVVECAFPCLFSEPPMVRTSVWLADTMTWDPENTDHPVVEHCVVNWWRPNQHLYGAANVSVTCRNVFGPLHVVADIEFSGSCIITPIPAIEEWKPTNPSFGGPPPPPPPGP